MRHSWRDWIRRWELSHARASPLFAPATDHGAFIGGFLFGVLGFAATGLIGQIISATVGAVVLLLVLGLLKKA